MCVATKFCRTHWTISQSDVATAGTHCRHFVLADKQHFRQMGHNSMCHQPWSMSCSLQSEFRCDQKCGANPSPMHFADTSPRNCSKLCEGRQTLGTAEGQWCTSFQLHQPMQQLARGQGPFSWHTYTHNKFAVCCATSNHDDFNTADFNLYCAFTQHPLASLVQTHATSALRKAKLSWKLPLSGKFHLAHISTS